MNPIKLKMFASTFLLIFFYFPKSMDGFVSNCDGRNCVVRSRTNVREFERYPLKRENRVINVRDRVGAERLVNNRRIVDSDSRISEYLESRNFDFPRLVERTRQSRVCIARGDFTNKRVGDERNVRSTREQESRDVRVEERRVRMIRESQRVHRESTKDDTRNYRVERNNRRQDHRDGRVQVSDIILNRDVRVQNRDRVERLVDRTRQIRDSRITRDHENLLDRDIHVRVTRDDERDESRDSRVQNRETRVENRDSRLTRDHQNSRVLNRDIRVRLTREDGRDERRNSRMEDSRQTREHENSRLINRDMRVRATREDERDESHNSRKENRATSRFQVRDSGLTSESQQDRLFNRDNRVIRNSRMEDRDARDSHQATQARVTNQNRKLHVTRSDKQEDRDARPQSRLIDSRDSRVENRISRDADVTRRERISRNLNSKDTSRASETLISTRASESYSSRRDIRQPQRTNERNVRSQEIPEADRRNVDVNNNRRVAERRISIRDSQVREHYQKNHDLSQWSHLLTTTIGVLLLAQIITSSETKKFGITHFLHGIKEKIY